MRYILAMGSVHLAGEALEIWDARRAVFVVFPSRYRCRVQPSSPGSAPHPPTAGPKRCLRHAASPGPNLRLAG